MTIKHHFRSCSVVASNALMDVCAVGELSFTNIRCLLGEKEQATFLHDIAYHSNTHFNR